MPGLRLPLHTCEVEHTDTGRFGVSSYLWGPARQRAQRLRRQPASQPRHPRRPPRRGLAHATSIVDDEGALCLLIDSHGHGLRATGTVRSTAPLRASSALTLPWLSALVLATRMCPARASTPSAPGFSPTVMVRTTLPPRASSMLTV